MYLFIFPSYYKVQIAKRSYLTKHWMEVLWSKFFDGTLIYLVLFGTPRYFKEYHAITAVQI